MKPVLARLVTIVVLAIAGQALAWEVACGIRSFYYPTQEQEISFCKDSAGRSINVLTGVLATLLALLVDSKKADGE